ncbi:nucleotidyl transferase AbiEii/AbiGii toxin family protein [Gemmatimonas sp.]|uniref:nucleotidyl transferase AbiEii/AbiGii toxin family protein n=1 Tax=Gemmatimonas sp. TaxID=1962908 RepID=UPI003340802A
MNETYRQIITASVADRTDLFLATAQRLGTPLGNVEKDFWVCWTLGALYHRLPSEGPRLLFKGGTSLSKAYGLIRRFSEDIDVTVFRDDLGEEATVSNLESLSRKKRDAKLDAIRNACQQYITGPLRTALERQIIEDTGGQGEVLIDPDDPDQQTLLVSYPAVTSPAGDAYVRPVVRIESGAKSALDPNRLVTLRPYLADDVDMPELAVPAVRTIEPGRTFWDKVVILHGLRRWYDRRGRLRQEGQRISRHYYDLHCLLQSEIGSATLADRTLGAECVRHSRLFFDRPDHDLASVTPGTFALKPHAGMTDALARDYRDMVGMIFGAPPTFDEVLTSIGAIEDAINIVAP